jgi:hypothetical protein
MSPRITRRLVGIGVAACAVAAYAASCTDLPSDPKTPFSIELRSPGSPGVARADTLRDSLGIVAPLHAVAFNSSGDSIPGADITYHVVPVKDSTATVKYDSTPARIDASGRLVIARSETIFVKRTFRVYAQAGGLQTVPIVFTVTRRPDSLIAGHDTAFTLRFPDTLPQIPLVVRLKHTPVSGESAGDTTVPAWLVRYEFVRPDSANHDTTYLAFTGGSRGSRVDTTDANGVASRSVRIRYTAFPFQQKAPKAGTDTIYDTVQVRARAYAPGGAEVPPGPYLFTIVVKAKQQGATP